MIAHVGKPKLAERTLKCAFLHLRINTKYCARQLYPLIGGSKKCKFRLTQYFDAVFQYLLHDPPRRELRPRLQRVFGPLNCLIGVAGIAGIRNFQRLRCRWRNELEGVAANVDITYCLFDFRHMAADAFIAGRSSFVMGMLLDRWRVRAVR